MSRQEGNKKRYKVLAQYGPLYGKNSICFELDDALPNSVHLVDEAKYSEDFQCDGNHSVNCWWYGTDEVEEIGELKAQCKCDVFLTGCRCGVFQKEMENSGLVYNKALKSWRKNGGN